MAAAAPLHSRDVHPFLAGIGDAPRRSGRLFAKDQLPIDELKAILRQALQDAPFS